MLFLSLKKVLGWPELLALGTAGIIGTSWVYMNTRFYDIYGPGGTILGYLIGTLMAALIALAYAEMGSAIKREGGEVAFVYPILGIKGSFAVAWMFILGYLTGALSFYVIGIGLLLSWIFPQIYTIPIYYVAGEPVYLPALIIGIVGAIIFFSLNYIGAKIAGRVQLVLFGVLIGLGITILITSVIHGSLSNIQPFFKPGTNPLLLGFRFALISIGYLAGFEMLPVLAEEAAVKPRTFGAVVAGSVVLAGLFYATMMFAGSLVMPWQEAVKVAPRGLIDEMAMIHVALGGAAWLASIIGLVTSWNAAMMGISRIVFAMARAGLMPKAFEYIHPKYGTPTKALIFVTIISIILGSLGLKGLIWFLDVTGVALGFCWIISVLAMLIARKKPPHLHRPFKVPAGYVVGSIALILALIIWVMPLIPGTPVSLVWPYEYLLLIAWVILGIIMYLISRKRIKELGVETIARNLLGEYYDEIYGARSGK